ncbi:hypothetical protein G6F70_002161 [Rhizopus microsporus]|uniref:Kinesin-domain-containing protein n=1 Tax=Rhizopus microsporus TaxID=58291 RepID=A0A1X0RSC5_RHIZD|nr:hypothetical protein G6F71_004311 [Rhizopus microsporus]KAG1202534.1 hypothetical protein G6F70_002161 [Rhizopus microsporus]KAG1211825.1 hypothetical protein G6F69_004247 [Rhizopus microsporus]KAG1233399.1 hypothetical protein G6F67_004297 [Rhizopus microsporus]KAG1265823.1 hypothetical protein G6F68_003261 [Rhizopus microsporus]
MTSTAVRVGLRVRPLTQKEQLSNCTECISFIPNEPQILLGTDKSFTYDYVFSNEARQEEVYQKAAAPLLEKFIEGFNATILAYGQTGSGKTYSMGTGLEATVDPEHEGIVPRCIVDLFRKLQAQSEPEFKYEVYVSFLELYNEELIDLLNPHTALKKKGALPANVTPVEVTIREDIAGNIYWSGVREELCHSPEELMSYLAKGSLCRTTGSTDMNTVSSRSHAVFSVILKQQKSKDEPALTSKFHFVDLAGSERLKRTNAQGDRAKEGISINSGLLALGNVISALGDESRKTTHVPYRDSKLTRLLQDSLGGNSQTLMLACVSPADSNFMETLNTLKYANRARNIKNRVTINQDFAGSSMEVNQLRAQLARLRLELASARAEAPSNGSLGADQEVRALRAEVSRLRDRIQDMSTTIIQLTSERDTMIMERELGEFINDQESMTRTVAPSGNDPVKTHPLVAQYQKTIQDLTNELSDTRDRLAFVESTKATNMHAAPISFSSTFYPEHHSSSHRRRTHGNHSSNSSTRFKRKRYPRNSSANSSAVTTMSARKTSGVSVRRSPIVSRSSSLKTSRRRNEEPEDDEGYINEDDHLLQDEIKQSIAKAKAEIQKGMEVLDLLKPMEDATRTWEEELEAFEKAEKAMYEKANQIERSDSDEGNYTSTSSPIDHGDMDLVMEIETLSVPSWEPHISRSTATKKTLGNHVFDDAESGSASSTDSTAIDSVASSVHNEKPNPQLARMLHQIQSDIRVKEELVTHLEKTETKYAFMRRKFDEKIAQLHQQLIELQSERDEALAKTKQAFAANASHRTDVTAQMKEKQQLLDTRHAYETKMKQLVTEIHELKRNYNRTITNMQSTRNQQESLLRTLRVNVETLKVEKKRMIKRMKQETERVREQMAIQERKISKLQRQHSEINHVRLRLEREHEAQKATLKRRDKEILISQNQVKMLTDLVKKAVREGGVLDEQLLSKVSHIIGGSFAAVARRGGMRNLPGYRPPRRRKNPIPVEVRVSRKKQLLDKMLYQYIQGKQAIVEMEQLLFRRERLAAEKLELLEERKNIYMAERETSELTGQPMDTLAIDLADERVDLIEAEISYLSARIKGLQSEAAGEADEAQSPEAGKQHHEKRKVTFADDIVTDPPPSDEWTDMDALEEQFNVPANAAPELVYDATIRLLKSLEVDECRNIIEALVDDIFNSRMNECSRQMTMQNLEKTVHDLRRTLIVMKRAAIATTVENERRIRKLEEQNKGMNQRSDRIDTKIEDYIMNSGNTIFDKIYEDGLRGLLGTPEPEYTMQDSPDEASVSTCSYERRSSTHSDGLLPPPSPITLPAYTSSTMTRTTSGVRAPAALTEKGNAIRTASYPARESTPSPDRFYNMIQKRLSWQQRTGGSESPIHMTLMNPAEFARYANDRESSTSSIRSGHLRRASLQSDYSSSQASHNNTVSSSQSSLLRKRSFSVQQPPIQPQQLLQRRRASLRELSLKGTNMPPVGSMMASNSNHYMTEYDHEGIMTPTMSLQRSPGQLLKRQSLISSSTIERAGTPTNGNVFDRLSQTPTRASQAKISHRHSSSSMDELRARWEYERTPSAMSGTYQDD